MCDPGEAQSRPSMVTWRRLGTGASQVVIVIINTIITVIITVIFFYRHSSNLADWGVHRMPVLVAVQECNFDSGERWSAESVGQYPHEKVRLQISSYIYIILWIA